MIKLSQQSTLTVFLSSGTTRTPRRKNVNLSMAPRDLKTPQDAPKTHPRRPKSPPRRPKDGPRPSKTPQDAPRIPPRDAPKTTQEGSKRAKMQTCCFFVGFKSFLGIPRDPKTHPRRTQDAPRRTQDAPRHPRDAPKTLQRAIKTSPRRCFGGF